MEVVTVQARLEHAFVLASNMRPNDVRELEACGQSPLEGVLIAMRHSRETGAALFDDELGAMFGVCPAGDRRGTLWFLTGHLFESKPVAFTRWARRWVAALLVNYDVLGNFIDGRYTQALRFAETMGAVFGSPVQVGGVPFVPFTIRRT